MNIWLKTSNSLKKSSVVRLWGEGKGATHSPLFQTRLELEQHSHTPASVLSSTASRQSLGFGTMPFPIDLKGRIGGSRTTGLCTRVVGARGCEVWPHLRTISNIAHGPS